MFIKNVFVTPLKSVIAAVVLASGLSACALMSTYVDAPGVDIDKLSTPTARVVIANLWRDGQQLSLRGEVIAKPVSRSPMPGHVDIEIVRPDREGAICLTTHLRLDVNHMRKHYSVDLEELPPPGSRIRVWYHPTSQHESCDDSILPLMPHTASDIDA